MNDLGLDSLDVVEIVMAFEDEFGALQILVCTYWNFIYHHNVYNNAQVLRLMMNKQRRFLHPIMLLNC